MMQLNLLSSFQTIGKTLNEVVVRLKSLEENQVQFYNFPSSKELLSENEFKAQLLEIVKNEWPYFLKENLKSFRYFFSPLLSFVDYLTPAARTFMQKYAKDYPSVQINRSCATFEESYFLNKEDKVLIMEVASGFYDTRVKKKQSIEDHYHSDSSSKGDSDSVPTAVRYRRNEHREELLEFMQCAWGTLPHFQNVFGNVHNEEYFCSNLNLAAVISLFTDAVITFIFADKPNIIFADGTSIIFPNKDGK